MDLRTPLRLAWRAGYILLVATSCREATTPVDSAKAPRLSPASPTQLTGTVGTPVADVPSVVVRDLGGQPVAGVVVTFSVRSGGGTIQSPRVVSSSNGIASVAAWTLVPRPE
jgi:hypothetical protein